MQNHVTPIDILMRQHDRAEAYRREFEQDQDWREIQERSKAPPRYWGRNLPTVTERN